MTTSLFAHRDYRLLFTAQVAALFGTGLTTVALGLLAYELAGGNAAIVLGTALTLKMVAYVIVAPIAGAYAGLLPRRQFLMALNGIRGGIVLALPFVDQIWQIYVLITLLQIASAAYTPTYQAVLPDILPDERDYTKALSAAQLAATMETLLSPMLAALALSLISFHWLFVGTGIGFAVSVALVMAARIPNAVVGDGAIGQRLAAGLRLFAATPRLRGLLGLNLVVAAAGSVVMVNTVNYARDVLGGDQSGVALLLAANGFGTMLVALTLPKILDRRGERPVMLTGAAVLVTGLVAAITLSTASIGDWSWAAALATWAVIGAGTGLVLTPTGRVLRRSARAQDRPALFAAQFSLSHLAWLITYPITGWLATTAGFTTTWITLAVIAALGVTAAIRLWPRHDPAEITHIHDFGTVDPAILTDATEIAPGRYQHTHPYVIDPNHTRWPTRVPALV
ncbi:MULTISPECIES: MFS transporter [Nocardia]|uniref:MFS transporter n=1 Tax=Nocardia TaxID=1817 RepID=UPI00292FD157|nr:MFS transporter [Nocardia canadensis]